MEETHKTLKNGWIYTGDLGKFDEDGFLFITGRKKNIIISPSGLNVYPEDIEKILNKLSGVKDSVVIGLEQGKKLIAILLSDEKIDSDKILKEANSRLQSHQILSQVIQWSKEDFPRTTTRKIIRRKVEEEIEEVLAGKIMKEKEIKDKLVNLISDVLEVKPEKIKEKTLLRDLGLDSLKRIDLAIKIEDAYDIEEFNEDEITDQMQVKNLRKSIEKSKEFKPESGINWLNSKLLDPIRFAIQCFVYSITSIIYTRTIIGKENLRLIPKGQPVIFIANHHSLFDSFAVYRALPLKYRMRTYPAGAKDFFFENPKTYMKFLGIIARLSFNTFSFSRTRGIKQSLRDFGQIINRGGNILIYPEGIRSWSGKILPFKLGIGLLAWHLQVPVVPIRHRGLYHILPRGALFPKSGHIDITIGKPMSFSKMYSFEEIAEKLHKELEKL